MSKNSVVEENDDLELDALIEQLGPCARPYWNLDECMDKHNHNWTACKDYVKELKQCWTKEEELGRRKVQQDRQMMFRLKELKQERDKKRQEKAAADAEQ